MAAELKPRISDATLRTICEIIHRTDGVPDGEHGTFGDALRAAALDLLDLRTSLVTEKPC